jgi:hypothetical protein
MLHHPFVAWEDLLSVEGQVYKSYVEAFWACTQLHTHPQDFYTDPEADSEAEELDSDDESDEDIEEQALNDYPLADFEAFARRRPQDDFTRSLFGQPRQSGDRL